MTSSEPKPIAGSVSGFTPCPDILVSAYSHTTALIWGKIWRYSQMADGVCRASILRLCTELKMTDKTVAKHIAMLESGGYVEDTTPAVRYQPHIYKDTGKLQIKIAVFMEDSGGTEKFRTRYGKIPYKESTTKGRELQNIFTAYESNIGALTPMIAENLKTAEIEYSAQWILDAFELAVSNNKRNWRYCEAILKRWQESGKDDGKGGKPEPTHADALKAALKKQGYDV